MRGLTMLRAFANGWQSMTSFLPDVTASGNITIPIMPSSLASTRRSKLGSRRQGRSSRMPHDFIDSDNSTAAGRFSRKARGLQSVLSGLHADFDNPDPVSPPGNVTSGDPHKGCPPPKLELWGGIECT